MRIPDSQDEYLADLNVTPFVDVVLVLLVIFMITAPMLLNQVPLNLPRTQKGSTTDLPKKPMLISIAKDGTYYFDKDPMALDELMTALVRTIPKKDQTIYIRGDEFVSYGKVAELMALLKNKGFLQLSLITEVKAR